MILTVCLLYGGNAHIPARKGDADGKTPARNGRCPRV
jgi:hypothetical protein